MSVIGRKRTRARLFTGGAGVAALLALAGLGSPASASSSGWEAILGGHITSASAAQKIASQAASRGFSAHVQKIASSNYEAEIFNGGKSKAQADAVCAQANRAGGLPHCSVEQEFHGDGWSKSTTTTAPGATTRTTSPTTPTTHSTAPPKTTTTSAPPSTTTTAPHRSGSSPAPARSGYWLVGADGVVYAFGAGQPLGNAPVGSAEAVDLEPTPSGNGYWIIDDQGAVYPFGDATWKGNVDRARLEKGETVTSLAATHSGNGYWIFTTRGRVLPFGDAAFYGDTSGMTMNGPVLDSVPTASGQGYSMVASDGGIFAFGDARFYGSMGGKHLNAPVQSLVPDPDGLGYWLVASDGGVFAFEAPFQGSMGAKTLNRPVTGMVPFGNGYLMVGEDGGIFNFSDRPFFGSLGDNPPAQPITSGAVLDES